jgi:hypothetical protein
MDEKANAGHDAEHDESEVIDRKGKVDLKSRNGDPRS